MTDDRSNAAGGPEEPGDYCRSVETYLCRKNDGHLIRIAGPAFTRVSGWSAQGIPLNVVFRGIDRYFERYYARGPRRRPVQIDFCENDVLDAFDEWRRAVGLWVGELSEGGRRGAGGGRREAPFDSPAQGGLAQGREASEEPRTEQSVPPPVSLAAHVERVIVRLTTLRAGGRLKGEADRAVASAIRELDGLRAAAREHGETAREWCVGRLREIDELLLASLRESLETRARTEIDSEAHEALAPFKAGMAEDAYRRGVDAAVLRLLRERFGLPMVAYESA